MLDLNQLDLRPHQRLAVDRTERYLETPYDGRSCLIHQPTGSGKTGIMATLSRRCAERKPVLVVCPSAALATQLEIQFRRGFWDRIAAPDKWRFRNTARLTPSRVSAVTRAVAGVPGEKMAVFSTIQALQQIYANKVDYDQLINIFGVVFFDEGHREPAPQWARAARGLGAPTVLFSATPYRNDLKVFDVDQEHTSFLSFKEAYQAGIIRPVVITELDLPMDAAGFAATVVRLRDELVLRGKVDPTDKMIIRAGEESEVDALFNAISRELANRNDGVIAVHNTYRTEGRPGAWKYGEVPAEIAKRSEVFLIHQHMLTEGIDDPSCTMLTLFTPFSSERPLVQQVGRLTRHPGPFGAVALPGRVFARRGERVADMWNRYLAYDAACIANGGRPPLRDRAFIDRILAALPELDYVEGQFRSRANFNAPGIQAEVRVPLSAVIFTTKDGFDLGAFTEAISTALDEEDRIQVVTAARHGDATCHFHLSISLHQTPLLADSLFQTASLELTIYAKRGGRLYFYDSGGLWADEFEELGPRLDPTHLGVLLPEAGKAVTAVTLRNTDLGPLALRGRSLQAASVAQAGVFLGEQTHVVTRAAGRPRDGVRRILGFTSARIRQSDGPTGTLAEFSDWCDEVGAELDARATPTTLFSRFATAIDPPANAVPLNILVDLLSYHDGYLNDQDQPAKIDLESACADIVRKAGGPSGFEYAFNIRIDEQEIEVWIKWDAKKQKYWLSSRELTTFYDKANPKATLLKRLNRQQPFRIIVASSTVYAYGRFYSIDLKLDRSDGPASMVLGLLTGVPGLELIRSEKGNLRAPAATWPADSLFGFIDGNLAQNAMQRAFGSAFKALVCDDLGSTEVADFIGVNDGPVARVVFIPAKWKDGVAGAGASGLYDVCGQALKNLAYLKADGQHLPGAARRFDQPWRLIGGEISRRRFGPGSLAFRRLFQQVRSNPNASREVWLVLAGGILSRAAVERELAQPIPPSHVLQLFHLLLSIYAGCQSIGVDLKVFCCP